MNGKAPPQASEAQEQARAERVRIANAFLEVFGMPKHRTTAQNLVLLHLERDASEESNAFTFTGGTDGLSIALAAAQKDGAQSRIRIINRQVRLSETEEVQKTKQPKTVKR